MKSFQERLPFDCKTSDGKLPTNHTSNGTKAVGSKNKYLVSATKAPVTKLTTKSTVKTSKNPAAATNKSTDIAASKSPVVATNKSLVVADSNSPVVVDSKSSVATTPPSINNKLPFANDSKSPATVNINQSPTTISTNKYLGSPESRSPVSSSNKLQVVSPTRSSPSKSPSASSPTKSIGRDNTDNISTVDGANELEVSKYETIYTKNSAAPYSSVRADDGYADVNLEMVVISHMNNFYHFPIEFTCKDYMKKIFDILRTGIRIKVIEVTKDRGLKTIDDYDDYAVSHLLKQLMDETTLDGQTISHVQLFSELLSIDQQAGKGRFVNTINFLYELDYVLPLIDNQAEYYDLVLLTFEHTHYILDCFKKPVCAWYTSKASEELEQLLHLYNSHCKLKQSRIESYNASIQSNVASTTEGPVDEEVDYDLLLINIKQLTQEIHECLQPEDAAITKLVRRLLNYSSDITYFIQQSVKRANFKEVKMLKNLDIDIQYMLHLIKTHPVYGDGHHRLQSLQKISETAKIYLKQLSKMPDSHILYIQFEKSKQKLDMVINSYPFGVVVEYLVKVDHQSNLYNYLLANPVRSESILSLLRESQSTGKKIMQFICYKWYGISYETQAVDELFEPSFLKTLGFSMIDLKGAGYSLEDIKGAGYVIFKSYADELKASTGKDAYSCMSHFASKCCVQ